MRLSNDNVLSWFYEITPELDELSYWAVVANLKVGQYITSDAVVVVANVHPEQPELRSLQLRTPVIPWHTLTINLQTELSTLVYGGQTIFEMHFRPRKVLARFRKHLISLKGNRPTPGLSR